MVVTTLSIQCILRSAQLNIWGVMLDCNSPARQSLLQWKLTVVSVYLTLTFLHKTQWNRSVEQDMCSINTKFWDPKSVTYMGHQSPCFPLDLPFLIWLLLSFCNFRLALSALSRPRTRAFCCSVGSVLIGADAADIINAWSWMVEQHQYPTTYRRWSPIRAQRAAYFW